MRTVSLNEKVRGRKNKFAISKFMHVSSAQQQDLKSLQYNSSEIYPLITILKLDTYFKETIVSEMNLTIQLLLR